MIITCPNCKQKFDWEEQKRDFFVGDSDVSASSLGEPPDEQTITCPQCQHDINIEWEEQKRDFFVGDSDVSAS